MHNIFRIKRIGYYQWSLTLDAEVRSGPYILFVGSVTNANGQIELIQSTNFNRMQDGAWL